MSERGNISPNRQALLHPFLPIKNSLLPSQILPFYNSEYTHSTHRTHISLTLVCRWERYCQMLWIESFPGSIAAEPLRPVGASRAVLVFSSPSGSIGQPEVPRNPGIMLIDFAITALPIIVFAASDSYPVHHVFGVNPSLIRRVMHIVVRDHIISCLRRFNETFRSKVSHATISI